MVKLHQLKALIAIAEAGSIQGAARRNGVSQPALSKSIHELERQLGAKVIMRTTRGVTLTEYGDVAMKRALAIRREFEKLDEEIQALKAELGGKLTIGITPLAGDAVLAEAVSRFRARHPAVELRLLELRPNAIIEGMRQGTYDLGLLTLYGVTRVPGFETQVSRSYETALVAGGRRTTTTQEAIEDLLDDQWVDFDDAVGSGSYIHALTHSLGMPPPAKILTCTSLYLCAKLAAQLGAVTCMVEGAIPFIRSEIASGALTQLRLKAELPRMNVVLAYPDEGLLTPAAREMARLLRPLYS